jgi:hypothetical protein
LSRKERLIMEMFPWWGYLILAGIIFSTYMMVKTGKEEKRIENMYIEREGNVYIERMTDEKKRRGLG